MLHTRARTHSLLLLSLLLLLSFSPASPVIFNLLSKLSEESQVIAKDAFCTIHHIKRSGNSNNDLHKSYLDRNEERARGRERGEGGRSEWVRRKEEEGDCGEKEDLYFWDSELMLPLADTVFVMEANMKGDELNSYVTEQMVRQCRGLHRACIVFVKSDLISEMTKVADVKYSKGWTSALLKAIDALRKPVVLLTLSHEDLCMPYRTYPLFDDYVVGSDVIMVDRILNHENLVMWFTKNPCLVHPKLTALPIGLRWHPQCLNFHCDYDDKLLRALAPYAHDGASRAAFLSIENRTSFLAPPYFELLNTGSPLYRIHSGTRPRIFALFKETFGADYVSSVKIRESGYPSLERVELDVYFDTLKNSAVIFSPSGNGIDCHRTWEAVIFGDVAVVQSSPINAIYRDLPILFVRDWREVTEARLREELSHMKVRKYRWDKVTARYWVNMVFETAISAKHSHLLTNPS